MGRRTAAMVDVCGAPSELLRVAAPGFLSAFPKCIVLQMVLRDRECQFGPRKLADGMIQLISDDPVIVAAFERVPDALIQYHFVVRTGKRDFVGPSMLLRRVSNAELESRLQAYLRSDDELKDLQLDIRQRLGYSLPCYSVGEIPSTGYTPTDKVELLKLQGSCGKRVDAAVALSNELFRVDEKFRHLGHLTERGRSALVSSYFVYRAGRIWSSHRKLTDEQWRGLIDRTIQREDAILAAVTGGGSCGHRILEVRREVWRRDQGRCVQCGSQERLEFDHVIPYAMGGSSTARNVQLLCEACNRQKAATLGVH